MKLLRNKKGSSTVLLAIIITTFAGCISGAIVLSRHLSVRSECESFSRLWSKAILSEYDRHLLDDYGIMAFWGSEREVNRKLDYYMDYSCAGKLDARIGEASSYLGSYTLSDPDNFIHSISNSFVSDSAEKVIKGSKRIRRSGVKDDSNHVIGNEVVLDTLPSAGIRNSIDASALGKSLEENSFEDATAAVGDSAVELAFICRHMGNHMYMADHKKTYFDNEWEYIIAGKKDDDENYRRCRTYIFAIRNVLNLASLYQDKAKMAAIAEVSELITPGPAALLTQAAAAEVWAAMESEADIDTLIEGGRVPFLKKAGEWKVSLRSVFESEDIQSELDEESLQMMDENSEEIDSCLDKVDEAKEEITEGQNYEDYLKVMMLALNEKVRLLRIMDIVQIDMKYRYYDDFNMDEYYIGTEISIEANGREYESEGKYR